LRKIEREKEELQNQLNNKKKEYIQFELEIKRLERIIQEHQVKNQNISLEKQETITDFENEKKKKQQLQKRN